MSNQEDETGGEVNFSPPALLVELFNFWQKLTVSAQLLCS